MALSLQEWGIIINILVGLSILLPPIYFTLTSHGQAFIRDKFHLKSMEEKIDQNGEDIQSVKGRVEEMETRHFALIAAHSEDVDLCIEAIEKDAVEKIDINEVNQYLQQDQYLLRGGSDGGD